MRASPSAGAAGCRSRGRSAAQLLTLSAFLIDANGSVRWEEASFFLSYGNFKLKKSPSSSRLPGAVDRSHTPPPASSTLIASPQLAAAGAKNQSGAGSAGAQADKDFTRAEPESGSVRKAVTRGGIAERGSHTLFFSRGFL